MAAEHQRRPSTHKAGLFDIRFFIGALIGIYGVILLIIGLFDQRQAARAGRRLQRQPVGGIAHDRHGGVLRALGPAAADRGARARGDRRGRPGQTRLRLDACATEDTPG